MSCNRLCNPPHVELLAAAAEQLKITELRLNKLLGSRAQQPTVSEIAERRAGLVLQHVVGAWCLCHAAACKADLCGRNIKGTLCVDTPAFGHLLHSHLAAKMHDAISCKVLWCSACPSGTLSFQVQEVSNHVFSIDVAAGGVQPLRSPITTHVLDTSMGRPAPGMTAT